jgi:hypothetical protein
MKRLIFLFILAFGAGVATRMPIHQPYSSPSTRIQAVMTECAQYQGQKTYLSCFQKEIKGVLKSFGVTDTMKTLEAISSSNDANTSGKISCHTTAHIVGETALNLSNQVGQTISQCTRACGYGCVHGVVVGLLKRDATILNSLSNVCTFERGTVSFQDISACNHGLGHALAEVTSFSIEKSLNYCNTLKAQEKREECATGVFMEIFDGPTTQSAERVTLPENLIAYCESLHENFHNVCLRNAASYTLRRTNDLPEAFRMCESLPDTIREECAASLGADFHFMYQGDMTKIWAACKIGSESQQQDCIRGEIYSSLVTDPSGKLTESFCDVVDIGFKEYCATKLEEMRSVTNIAS